MWLSSYDLLIVKRAAYKFDNTALALITIILQTVFNGLK